MASVMLIIHGRLRQGKHKKVTQYVLVFKEKYLWVMNYLIVPVNKIYYGSQLIYTDANARNSSIKIFFEHSIIFYDIQDFFLSSAKNVFTLSCSHFLCLESGLVRYFLHVCY